MVDHNCSTVITSKTKKTNGKCFEPSYLKVKSLAPVFQGNSDVTSKQAVALLGKYLVETMTPAFAAKCVRAAKESSSESRETSAGKLDGYSKLLIENGWHCMVKTASAPEMKRMLIEKEKADHNLAVKNLSDAGKRKAGTFESGSVDCSEIKDGRSYMFGWSLASNVEIDMAKKGTLSPCVQIDACHCDNGGLLFRAFTKDAAQHLVPLLQTFTIENETEPSWSAFLHELCKLYPPAKTANITFLADMHPAISASLRSVTPEANRRKCYDHLKTSVVANAGIAMVGVFEEAAYAPTKEKYDAAMKNASPKLLRLLTQTHKPKEWAAHLLPPGVDDMASSGVEGMNGADRKTGVRELPLGMAMLEGLAIESQKRYYERVVESRKVAEGDVLPLVKKEFQRRTDALKQRATGAVRFMNKERTEARLEIKVKNSGGKTAARVVRLQGLDSTCECECAFPCGCILYIAEKTGVLWATLVPERMRASTFKAQYAGNPPYKVPGNETIALLEDGNCLLPPVCFAPKAGRPSHKRTKGAIEKVMQKATAKTN